MKKTREQEYIECDGCNYCLTGGSIVDEMAAMGEARITELRIPWKDEVLEFHFHTPRPTKSGGIANDCLRYFILNPYIVRKALRDRDFDDEEIELFLAQVSHREKATA